MSLITATIIKKIQWEDKRNRAKEDPIIKRNWNEIKKRIQTNGPVIAKTKPSKPDEMHIHKTAFCYNFSGDKGHSKA